MKDRAYTCACCGGQFITERTDDDARAEALYRFGAEALAAGPVATVCEDCARLVYQYLEAQR